MKTCVHRADTIEFDRFFVEVNEAKFQHGMNLDDFRTNFGRRRRDQIWAKVDLTKFQSRSTGLDSIEFRPGPILPNTTKFWPEPTWPNMATFGLGPDQSSFGQG